MSNKKLIPLLSLTAAFFAIAFAATLTAYIQRPVNVKYVEKQSKQDNKDQVVFDLGDGRKIVAPKDGTVIFEGDLSDIKEPRTTERSDIASGKGVEISSSQSEGKFLLELDFGAPSASIPDGGMGISGYANLGVKSVIQNSGSILMWLSGLSIIGGVVVIFWLKNIKLGLGLIGGGITLFVVAKFFEQFPWVLWLLFIAFIIIIAFILYDYWKNDKKSKTFDAIVAAGESLPEKIRTSFRKRVKAEMQSRGIEKYARMEVDQAKRANGTPRSGYQMTKEEMDLINMNEDRQPQIIMVPSTHGTEPTVID